MTQKEMLKWLKNEVTMSGTINISITDAEYERIMDKEILMVYQLYPVAAKHQFFIIHPQQFRTPEFRRNRTIQFPDCVLQVSRFEEMRNRNMIYGFADPDFAFNKTFMADMWIGSMMNLDSTMFRTLQWSIADQLKQFTLIDIKHVYNEADHTLLVTGHDPHVPVYCEVYTKVPATELYDDPWVRQWIAAKCKLNVAKTIGTFTSNLIGGVTVNYNIYTEEANNDINDCKEWWKNLRDENHFFYTTP